MAAYRSLPERLEAAQNRPLIQRCYQMTEILNITSTKELKSALPLILHEIFDFEKDQTQGWQLDRVFRSYSSELFDQIRRLLGPEGPLMKVINCLQMEPTALYEFPLKYIPAPARHMIEDGAVPAFYTNKLQGQSLSTAVLLLNAFELYMFHLAYALVSPAWQARNQGWGDLYEYIYPTVIDDLLVYFLPCDKLSLPSMPYAAGPHVPRHPLGQGSPGRTGYPGSPSSPSHQHSHHHLPHQQSLFKPSFVQSQRQYQQSLPVLDQAEAEVWRSETFLQVIVEFWLNQNSCGGNDLYPLGGFQFSARNFSKDPLKSFFEHFMPSLNQVKMVRLLVKYLHHFSNSASNISLSVTPPFQNTTQAPLDQFKRLVVPHILQRKLYSFLRHAFDRWPLDSCFRMVLETWLSYIQPWRYTDFRSRTQVEAQHSDTDLTKNVDDRWDNFVEENLLFYTVLTAKFIPRIYRMDLTSPYSAYMVYRVSRILSLNNLVNLIFKAEQELFGGGLGHMSADLGGSYLSSSGFQHLALPTQMLDMEGPSFQYMPFCGDSMRYNMHRVIDQLSEALMIVKNQQQTKATGEKESKSQGFFASLFSSSHGDNDSSSAFYSSPEHRRLPAHLEQSIHNFCNIFGVIRPATVSELNQALNTTLGDDSRFLAEGESSLPDCIQTSAGLRLTDIGRRQLMNKERKFDEFYVGDPDLQPVRSYENATLVRLLFQVCCFINSYFRAELTDFYQRPTFSGRFARVFLRPPASHPEQQQFLKRLRTPLTSDGGWSSTSLSDHHPRLSLRGLASYRTLAHLGLAYLLVWLLSGSGPTGFLFLAIAAVAGYGIVVAAYRTVAGEKIEKEL